MKKGLVVKDNALINASYTLDLAEQRLILLAIIGARETGQGISAKSLLHIHAHSYAEHFGVNNETAYTVIKEASKKLFDRYVTYHDKNPQNGRNRSFHCRWVDKIGYEEKSGLVYLRFTLDVVPLITQLEDNFTKYELEQVSHLTSSYAVRLYELLICWRNQGKTPIFEVASFREQLGLGTHEYQTMGDFKKRVLDFAIRQINQHTDITATYAQHKQGRVIIGFSFKFKHKKPKGTQTAKNTGDNTAKKKPRQTTTKTLRSRLEKSGIAL
jgi:plasmid replication initiation protein